MRIKSNLKYVLSLASLAGGLALGQGATAADLEIKLSHADYVIAREARKPGSGYLGSSGFYDVMMPNLSIINRSGRPLTFDSAWIELSAKGEVLERSSIRREQIERALGTFKAYSQLNFPIALNVEFGAETILPPDVKVSETASTLQPGAALISTDNYVLTRGLPDTYTVIATARDADGKLVTGRASIAVEKRTTKNKYVFPLEPGQWFVISYPGIDSHHRFTQATEFGMDITKVSGGGDWHKDKGRKWTDWYGYGAKVLAAADGEVIRVVADSDLDPAEWLPRDGESAEDYDNRMGERQLKRFLAPGADPAEVAGGNYILIQHANGEVSQYAHLAAGSVRVRAGDKVRQGQHIAGVGGTGEAPSVHLHFQIGDAYDLRKFTFHTLPVEFTNVQIPPNARQSDETGYFVLAR